MLMQQIASVKAMKTKYQDLVEQVKQEESDWQYYEKKLQKQQILVEKKNKNLKNVSNMSNTQ